MPGPSSSLAAAVWELGCGHRTSEPLCEHFPVNLEMASWRWLVAFQLAVLNTMPEQWSGGETSAGGGQGCRCQQGFATSVKAPYKSRSALLRCAVLLSVEPRCIPLALKPWWARAVNDAGGDPDINPIPGSPSPTGFREARSSHTAAAHAVSRLRSGPALPTSSPPSTRQARKGILFFKQLLF